ncbi:hypothetical protein CK203_068152 [Vitis vinifera]|uniref:Uncharacterized protein n=1 Tax=Vitis vinifera TaxID=29760 RepID=A0A438E1J1_VITVI|nr:hypothetical protein CK203_068152 [Vitis vinifera]
MMHSRNERRAWYGGVEGDTGFKVGSGNKVSDLWVDGSQSPRFTRHLHDWELKKNFEKLIVKDYITSITSTFLLDQQ